MDFITDKNPRFLSRVLDRVEDCDFPEYVKNASFEEEDLKKLPRGIFADWENREFPTHTKSAVWLGVAYAEVHGQATILPSLEKAAVALGIKKDIDTLRKKLSSGVKSASTKKEKEYALSVTHEGEVHNWYPVNSLYQVEESARKLAEDCWKMPHELFKSASEVIATKAREHGVEDELPWRVKRAGSEPRLLDFDHALEWIPERVRELPENKQEAEAKYVDVVKRAFKDKPANIGAYIQEVIDLDRRYSIKYAQHTMLPHELFEAGPTLTEARELEKMAVQVGPVVIPLQALKDIPKETLQVSFRKAAADKLYATIKKAETSFDLEEVIGSLSKEEAIRLVKTACQQA